MKQSDPETTSIEHLRADLERELPGAVPGFEVVDRDLVVSDTLTVDWIGVDGSGSLVLVLWTDGAGADVVLDVLDALSFVRSHLDVLARHWRRASLPATLARALTSSSGSPGSPGRAPVPIHAVCLAPRFDVEALERLGPALGPMLAAGSSLELLEVHVLRSQAGEGAYLVPARHPALDPGAGRARASFLDALPEETLELGRAFLARMARIDDALEVLESSGYVEWVLAGETLGALRAHDGRLEASMPGFEGTLAVRGEADIDEFVDQALGRLVDLTGGPQVPVPVREPGGRAAPYDPSASSGDPLEADDLPPLDEGEDLAQVELIPMESADSGPLLTPEEIEAFRD